MTVGIPQTKPYKVYAKRETELMRAYNIPFDRLH